MLPLVTTTVTMTRPAGGDPFVDGGADTAVAAAVPARVSAPTGRETRGLGAQETVDAVLYVDASVDVRRGDTVSDDVTGDRWQVTWTRVRRGLGLDHVVAGLTATTGSVGDAP